MSALSKLLHLVHEIDHMSRFLIKCIVLNICWFLSFLCDSCFHGNMKNKSHGSLLFKFPISLGTRGGLARQAKHTTMDQNKVVSFSTI